MLLLIVGPELDDGISRICREYDDIVRISREYDESDCNVRCCDCFRVYRDHSPPFIRVGKGMHQ